MSGKNNTSCGACKFLRRKCRKDCVFSPYFRYDEGASHFGAIHKVFGASNVSRLLLHLPDQHRTHAAFSVAYEALARMHDPVYGCVAHIYSLQHQVTNLQEEIDVLSNQMVNNMNTLSTSDYYELLQATNYGLINNESQLTGEALIPSQYSNNQHQYQYHPDLIVDEAKNFNVMNRNYELETVVPTIYEENGACGYKELSNEASVQNLSNYIYYPNYYDEKVLDDVFNQEMFL